MHHHRFIPLGLGTDIDLSEGLARLEHSVSPPIQVLWLYISWPHMAAREA